VCASKFTKAGWIIKEMAMENELESIKNEIFVVKSQAEFLANEAG
jgi:hypothetical protein